MDTDDEEQKKLEALQKKLKAKKRIKEYEQFISRKKSVNKKKFTAGEVAEKLEERGYDPTPVLENRSKKKVNPISDFEIDVRGRKRHRAGMMSDDEEEGEGMEVDEGNVKRQARSKLQSLRSSRREGSAPPRSLSRIETEEQGRLRRKIERKFKKSTAIHESDRRIADLMPKHLYSGKRGVGKADRR